MSADREVAPAHASEAPQRLDITWLCPFCGRNTFRSFAVDGLLWSEGP
jgi:transcription elongation factor Elf1